jgi:TetR/AcrR family transcriptional regulator
VSKKEKKTTGEIAKQRKAIILQAAEKAFAQNGFKGTSIQKVAELADLPKTNVLYYFKSKMVLYSTLIQEILHTWNSSFDGVTIADEPNVALANYIAEKMEMSRLNPNASKIFGLEILNGAQNFDASFKAKHKAWFDGRVNVIEGWINSGKMRSVDAEYLLYHIWASTQHYADFSAQIKDLRGSTMQKKDFAKATNTVISLILTGCGLLVPKQYLDITND